MSNQSTRGGPGRARARIFLSGLAAAALTALAAIVAACGGGGSGTMTSANSAPLQVAITDADGDFIRYAVNVVSLDLTRANGAVVHTLPPAKSTLVDFAQLVDVTELLTTAAVPSGAYSKASITLDFSQADIEVEVAGAAVKANVVDGQGNPLTGTYTLDIQLDNANKLVIAPGIARMLTLDFNLAASNAVDLSGAVPVVTVSPVLVTSLDKATGKKDHVRGTLVSVDTGTSTYVVNIRPCWREDDEDFGQVTVHVTDATTYEIDGTAYTGAAGLAALAAMPAGTLTEARGALDPNTHELTADTVAAGSSAIGDSGAAVQGVVVSRSGDNFVVRGGSLIEHDGGVSFSDHVTVTVDSLTKVVKDGDPAAVLDIGAISVGQRVRVFGTPSPAPQPLQQNSQGQDGGNHGDTAVLSVDATGANGRVKLLATRLDGVLASGSALTNPGPLTLRLQSIEGRSITDRHGNPVFDFTGTGASQDADPAAYGVATGALTYSLAAGNPVRVYGFVTPFGQATPDHDFDAQTLVDFASGHARLEIGWGDAGTTAPFVTPLDATAGLMLDAANVGLGSRHRLVVGGVVTDLTTLGTQPTLVAPASGPAWYGIKQGDSLQSYTDFAQFVAALNTALDGTTVARGLFAEGNYDGHTGTFAARFLVIAVGAAD